MAQYLRALWLLLLAALAYPGVAQPAAWHQVALDSVARVEFPDSFSRRPVDAQGQTVYVCQAGPTLFIAVRQPHNRLLGLLGNNSDFLNGMVQGILKETGGTLLHRADFQVSGFSGVEVQFTTPPKAQLPATKFTRMVMVNGNLYTLNYWTNAEQDAASLAERNQFFNSFQLATRPATVGDSAYRLGKLVGGLFACVLVVGLVLITILYLVRRRNPTA